MKNMPLDKEFEQNLKVPRCSVPSENWQYHQNSGKNLCKYADVDDCPYIENLLGLIFCTFGEKKEREKD